MFLIPVVSKNSCNSRFLPLSGVTVVVADDTPQHSTTTHWPDGLIAHFWDWNLVCKALMWAYRVEERYVFAHHAA
jgi:hypothetical protein